MTVIAGLVHEGQVYLGADSATAVGGRVFTDPSPKIFTHRNGMLIGTAGNVRAGDILQFEFSPPPRNEDQGLDEYMRWTFPKAVRETFGEHTHVPTTHGFEDAQLHALIGWRGALYELHCDYSVTRSAEPYAAVGSGGELALAVLHVTPELPPEERLQRALQAAAHYNAYCRPPFAFLTSAAPP